MDAVGTSFRGQPVGSYLTIQEVNHIQRNLGVIDSGIMKNMIDD
jgi:hypothetical protein